MTQCKSVYTSARIGSRAPACSFAWPGTTSARRAAKLLSGTTSPWSIQKCAAVAQLRPARPSLPSCRPNTGSTEHASRPTRLDDREWIHGKHAEPDQSSKNPNQSTTRSFPLFPVLLPSAAAASTLKQPSTNVTTVGSLHAALCRCRQAHLATTCCCSPLECSYLAFCLGRFFWCILSFDLHIHLVLGRLIGVCLLGSIVSYMY